LKEEKIAPKNLVTYIITGISNKSILKSRKYWPLLGGKAGVDGDCLPVLVETLPEGEGVGLHQQAL
jgi:hypothetical protein